MHLRPCKLCDGEKEQGADTSTQSCQQWSVFDKSSLRQFCPASKADDITQSHWRKQREKDKTTHCHEAMRKLKGKVMETISFYCYRDFYKNVLFPQILQNFFSHKRIVRNNRFKFHHFSNIETSYRQKKKEKKKSSKSPWHEETLLS